MLSRPRLSQVFQILEFFRTARFLLAALVSCLCATAVAADPASDRLRTIAQDPRWLRLYQYEKRFGRGFVSDVTNQEFFFSERGRRDPVEELNAALRAYSTPTDAYGSLKLPAACAFPARKKVLESLMGESFPETDCRDLKHWVERIDAGGASLVFVGAYSGNPASILGHTFLRLSSRARESSGRTGADLLSHSIGYMARTDPDDNRFEYMLKGLTGGYPGYFSIEPHYVKVGLYNNSEARDLWELPLDLSTSELELLVLHLWELSMNAEIPYWFLDENCSYRLIKLVESVRADLDVSKDFPAIVLPAETVRSVIGSKVSRPEMRFRSSVLRRMAYKTSRFSPEAKRWFQEARSSKVATEQIEDPKILDALLDHWLYTNYKAETRLDERSAEIMEATLRRAARLRDAAPLQPNDEDLRRAGNLKPPFSGHRPRWIEIQGGAGLQGSRAQIEYRSGVHPFWSPDSGYEDISSIEYLGANVEWNERGKTNWTFLLAKALAVDVPDQQLAALAWSFEAEMTNACRICDTDTATGRISGGAGLATKIRRAELYLLAHGTSSVWHEGDWQGSLMPGLLAGARVRIRDFSFVTEGSSHFGILGFEKAVSARFTWQPKSSLSSGEANTAFLIESRWTEASQVRAERAIGVGWALFFD